VSFDTLAWVSLRPVSFDTVTLGSLSLCVLRHGGIGPLCLRILGHRRTGNLSPACPSTRRHLGACTIRVVRHGGKAHPTCRKTHWRGFASPATAPLLPSRRPGFPLRRSVDWWVRLPSESLAVVIVGYCHRGGCSLSIGLVLPSGLVPTGVQWSAAAAEMRGKRSRATVLARLLDAPRGPPTTWIPPSCLLLTSPSISKKPGPHPAGAGRGSRLCEMRSKEVRINH
jgi:hypothetical protein